MHRTHSCSLRAAIYDAVGHAESDLGAIRYALMELAERVAAATEWLVVLKCLMVVHCMMRKAEGDRFRLILTDMLFGGRGQGAERRRDLGSGGGGGLSLFNLGGFKDDSSPEAREMSGWVHSFALYLEERCAVLAVTRCDPQFEAPSASRGWAPPQLLAHLPRLQSLLRRLTDTLPRMPRMHPVAAAAAVQTLRETRLLFRAVSDGVVNLVDHYFDFPPPEAAQALDMYRRAVRQVADLNAALRSLAVHEQFAEEAKRLPHPFAPPSPDFLKVMEDAINSPGGHTVIAPAAPAPVAPPPQPATTDAPAVPEQLAAWLASLQLSAHGPRLVADHKLAFVQDCRHLDEEDLKASGLAKVEARRLLAAAANLGGDTKPLSDLAAAPEGSARTGARACVRALVIGINAYAPVTRDSRGIIAPGSGPGALDNAVADAQAVHEALSKLPGAASTLLLDCTKAKLEAALKDFRDSTGLCKERGMKVVAAVATLSAASAEPILWRHWRSR
jgi:hypothetical protein